MLAYNQHHHLILRPDDVWTAILGQFNFYVNANAEKLCSQFVVHEGKKILEVEACGSRYSVDFGDLAQQMTDLIQENLLTRTLKIWILPDFTTTSHNDTVVCSALMMSTLKAYFTYMMSLSCGIPSVTLEGEKEDWEKLLARIDKLTSFGPEPSAWAELLKPILRRFVSAFDGEPDIDFWGKVCHHITESSGPGSISGWITAFCVWNSEGKWQGPNISGKITGSGSSTSSGGRVLDSERKRQGLQFPVKYGGPRSGAGPYRLVLDDIRYGVMSDNGVPVGYCVIDVKLNNNGEKFDCMMVSGRMGTCVGGDKRDTVSLLPTWFMFTKA